MNDKLSREYWKSFEISEIFEVLNSAPYHTKDIQKSNDGVPYITRTAMNNGLEEIIDDGTFSKNPANVISFGAESATFFYQEFEYITGNKMYYITNQFMNKYIGMFLVQSLQYSINNSGFGYGKGLTGTRLLKRKIMLPCDSKNNPDWRFMENYIKQERHKLVDKITEYYKNKITNLPMQAEYREYREFWLDDIVEVKSGVRLTKANQEIGRRPFIGASDSNNGITNFVNNTNSSIDRNILGVNYNGSVVENFYHSYEAVFSDDVKRLEFKDVRLRNKYGYLFLKQSILMQKEKYTYGYKFNADRMRRQKIVLPINSTGEIDYLFMMNTIRQSEKNLMLNIIDYYEAK